MDRRKPEGCQLRSAIMSYIECCQYIYGSRSPALSAVVVVHAVEGENRGVGRVGTWEEWEVFGIRMFLAWLLVAIGQTHWELIIGLAQCDGGTGTCFNGPYGSCTVHSPSPDYPDAGSLASMHTGQNPRRGKSTLSYPLPPPKQNSLCSSILVGIKKWILGRAHEESCRLVDMVDSMDE